MGSLVSRKWAYTPSWNADTPSCMKFCTLSSTCTHEVMHALMWDVHVLMENVHSHGEDDMHKNMDTHHQGVVIVEKPQEILYRVK